MEGLKSRDLSRTLPGDLLQLMDGEHELNKENIGIRAGGEAVSYTHLTLPTIYSV